MVWISALKKVDFVVLLPRIMCGKDGESVEQAIGQNKMGAMPAPRLLLNVGLPMVLSMVGQALYNLVDTFFVSQIPGTDMVPEMGDKAIHALTLAYPIQMLLIALMVGLGIATNTLMAQSLGRKDRQRASMVAGNALMISVLFFVLFFLFGAFGAKHFIESQSRDPLSVELGTTYLRIVTMASLGAIGYMCIEKFEMARGNTRATMIAQLAGAVVNIILDPIMIFGLFGLPAMGVAGAAWATVIGQFASFFISAYIHFFRNREVDHELKYLCPRREILRRFGAIGFPATVMQILAPIMSYGMNLILGGISASAVTAFGVYYKLQYFVFMAVYGLNNASISSTAYNFGMKNKKRVGQLIRCAVIYVVVIMLIGVLALQIFARPLVGLFAIAEGSANLCVQALRIVTLGFLFGGLNVILPGICQALGNGLFSLIVTLLRYVAVLLPLAYVFSITPMGSTLVWWAFPIAEAVAFAVAAVLTWWLYKKRVSVLET